MARTGPTVQSIVSHVEPSHAGLGAIGQTLTFALSQTESPARRRAEDQHVLMSMVKHSPGCCLKKEPQAGKGESGGPCIDPGSRRCSLSLRW